MNPRIIYNDDSCTLRTTPPPHRVEQLAAALDYLKGTQVDCLCWCMGEQLAYSWPSKVIENIYDLLAEGATLTPDIEPSTDVMYGLHRQGIDYLPLLIQRAHDQGLSFVGSFRMNDTHIKSYPDGATAPEFWKTHQHYRLWGATEGKSYYNAALDYSYAEVRNRYRDAIAEVATGYDVDGIELDFTRTPYFFQPEEAWEKREILTKFVREIRDLLAQISERKKRELTFILRVPSQERVLRTAGMDVRKWIKEGLTPVLVISELSNNYNQDIQEWLTLCLRAGVRLYPAVEAGSAYNNADFYSSQVRNPLAPRHDGSGSPRLPLETDLKRQRGAAQNLLAQKPQGIYMFNFACRLAEGKNILHTDAEALEKTTSVLNELGSLDTLAGKDKSYTFYPELPLYVEAGRPRRFHQTIPFAVRGEDIRESKVTLRFRQIAEPNPHADGDFYQGSIVGPGLLKYYLNDCEIAYDRLQRTPVPAGRIPSGFLLDAHESIEICVSGEVLRSCGNTLAFEMPNYPRQSDPYVYIYELEVEVSFG